ncbi:MAG: sugar translocase, partial [Frondihabitans sp.]|nr:sugar translocase [Frondihabitans sp.]
MRPSHSGSMTDPQERLEVDIVVPCYNEEGTLAHHVQRLHDFLSVHMTNSWRITIANNASTDNTAAIANGLAENLPRIKAVHLDQKGRGRALKAVWSASEADVLVYVDEDLSTDLAALLPLVAPLLSGHSDLAIGTRLARAARVIRGSKREFISRTYNFMLRTTMGVG